jgi:hypothetical protein
MTRFEVIRKYFGTTRPVTIEELKALTSEERKWLSEQAAAELGVEIDDSPARS